MSTSQNVLINQKVLIRPVSYHLTHHKLTGFKPDHTHTHTHTLLSLEDVHMHTILPCSRSSYLNDTIGHTHR